jgi:hypothetical protein
MYKGAEASTLASRERVPERAPLERTGAYHLVLGVAGGSVSLISKF